MADNAGNKRLSKLQCRVVHHIDKNCKDCTLSVSKDLGK